MITIKRRYTQATICEFPVETVKQAVEQGKADLEGANLRSANLGGADLGGANLRGANLGGEVLTKSPVAITNLRYWCLITEGYMRLGCKRFTHDEWANFDDETIAGMDTHALQFWKQWKAPLLAMCAAHAEQPAKE